MKLKKLISAVLALGMLASSMTIVAHAEAKPRVRVSVEKYEAVEGNKAYDLFYEAAGEGIPTGEDTVGAGIYIPTGCTGYFVTFSLDNVDLSRKNFGTNANTRLMGIQAILQYNPANVESILAFNGLGGMVDAESLSAPTGIDGLYKIATTAVATGLYPTANNTTATSVEDVLGIFISIKDNSKPVTFTAIGQQEKEGLAPDLTQVTLNTFSGGTAADASTYYNLKDEAMTFDTFTLGEAPAAVVTSIDIAANNNDAIAVNGTKTLTATVKDENGEAMVGETVAWSSSSDVATVSGGVVTAVKPGKATITATSTTDDSVKATYEVKVLPAVALGASANYTKDETPYVIWKNISITGSKWGSDFKVTFTATGVEPLVKDLDLGSKADEVSGDISFPMLLQTANQGVAAAITCTWANAQ